jgi:hypothetical protein
MWPLKSSTKGWKDYVFSTWLTNLWAWMQLVWSKLNLLVPKANILLMVALHCKYIHVTIVIVVVTVNVVFIVRRLIFFHFPPSSSFESSSSSFMQWYAALAFGRALSFALCLACCLQRQKWLAGVYMHGLRKICHFRSLRYNHECTELEGFLAIKYEKAFW